MGTFTYDAASRLTQADVTADPHRPITFTYDPLDRLLTETTSLGTVTYTYDSAGRRTSMTVSGQNPVTYTYGHNARLRTITQAPLDPVAIDYDAANRRTLLTLPNGVSTEYVYDPGSRLTALVYRNALSPLGDLTYQYDAKGNRTGVGGAWARSLLPEPVPSATYDAANRQLSFGGKTMGFDPNGNLTTLQEGSALQAFTWDARDRLRLLSGPSTTAAFAYDALGRRAQRTVNSLLTQFHYDGLDIVHEIGGAGDASYLRTLAIDEALARNQDTFFLAEALGSTTARTDPTGTLVTEYSYGPFGTTSANGTASANPFQYTGRENDGAGLYYYRARYYEPRLGRFVAEDPLKVPRFDNSYVYVEDNPLNCVDPSGLLKSTIFGGAGGRIVAPMVAADVTLIGVRSGTNGYGVGRLEAYAGGRVSHLGGGFAAGKSLSAAVVVRDVSEVSRLTEVFVDSVFGSISLFFDGREFVGVGLGTPSVGFGAGVFTPDSPSVEIKAGFDFPTLLPSHAPSRTDGLIPRVLGGRKG